MKKIYTIPFSLQRDETKSNDGPGGKTPPNLTSMANRPERSATMTTSSNSTADTTSAIGTRHPTVGPTCWVPLAVFQQLYQYYECAQPVFYVYG